MRMIKITFAFWCFLLLSAAALYAEDNRNYVETNKLPGFFEEHLERMSGRQGNRDEIRRSMSIWQKYCYPLGAPGREADKAEAVKLMTDAILDDANANACQCLIRQLGRIGDASCVPAVAKFLDNGDRLVRDEAVWALANIPCQEAVSALRDQLNREGDESRRVALQNALEYHQKREPVTFRSLDEILRVLEGSDKKAWEEALPQLAWQKEIKIADVPYWEQRFERLAPEAKILLMDALTLARDRSALPLAFTLVKQYAPLPKEENEGEKSNEEKEQLEAQRKAREAVQLAGFRALGPLGDSSAMNVLLENILMPEEVWRTIRFSLSCLNYDGADQQIIDAARRAKDDKDTLYRILEAANLRRATIFIPLFEESLSHEDRAPRSASVYALEGLGDPRAISALTNRFIQETEDNGIKERAGHAIVNISVRVNDEDGRGEVLCNVAGGQNDAGKAEMLPIIGRVGGQRAKEFVLNALNSGSEEVRDAAFKALCAWPDVEVADELYAFARGDDAKARQAARAYIRVVTLRVDGRPAEKYVEYFEKAMGVAKTAEDRQLLLTRVESGRSIEVFRFAIKYIDDSELRQAVCRAVVDMANDRDFHVYNREEVEPILDKVSQIAEDNSYKERIQRYKERIQR